MMKKGSTSMMPAHLFPGDLPCQVAKVRKRYGTSASKEPATPSIPGQAGDGVQLSDKRSQCSAGIPFHLLLPTTSTSLRNSVLCIFSLALSILLPALHSQELNFQLSSKLKLPRVC